MNHHTFYDLVSPFARHTSYVFIPSLQLHRAESVPTALYRKAFAEQVVM